MKGLEYRFDTPLTDLFQEPAAAEPYGETPYLEQIEAYANRALAKKAQGAPWIGLRGMDSLHEARAALLGARAAELPVYGFLALGEDLPEPQALLAAMLCLQELGAAAFGLELSQVNSGWVEQYALLYPYATSPLAIRTKGALSAAEAAALAQAGVQLFFAGEGQGPPLPKSGEPVRPPRPEDAPLLLCDSSGVYYLEEDFTQSERIACSLDMVEEILAQEEKGYDALCFHVESVDDAHFLGRNAHMVRCAVSVLAEGADALEMALVLYSGRALVDARSDLPQEELAHLARAYGAIIR